MSDHDADDHDTTDCAHCIEAAFASGALYLAIDEPRAPGPGAYIGSRWPKEAPGDGRVRFVHVISKPAGGEIRGYVLTADGALRLRLPCYSGQWPALDEATRSRVAGAATIEPYDLSAGGMERAS